MLSESSRTRLIRLLSMFSSDFDGEVSNAARMAHSLLQSHKLRWEDVVIDQEQTAEQPQKNADDDNEVELIRKCRRHASLLSTWERGFIESIEASAQPWGRLTQKQRNVLNRIVMKIKANEAWS